MAAKRVRITDICYIDAPYLDPVLCAHYPAHCRFEREEFNDKKNKAVTWEDQWRDFNVLVAQGYNNMGPNVYLPVQPTAYPPDYHGHDYPHYHNVGVVDQ